MAKSFKKELKSNKRNTESFLEVNPDVQVFLTSCELENICGAKSSTSLALTNQNSSSLVEYEENEGENISAQDEFDEVDPQIKAAILEMQKLDKILEQKTKRERNVKKSGIEMRKRYAQDLANLDKNRNKYHPSNIEIKSNANNFLALCDSTIEPDQMFGSTLDSESRNLGSVIVRPKTSCDREVVLMDDLASDRPTSASNGRVMNANHKLSEMSEEDQSRINALLIGIDDAPLEILPENEEINVKLPSVGDSFCPDNRLTNEVDNLDIKLRTLHIPDNLSTEED